MSYLNLLQLEQLADSILEEYNNLSNQYSSFQKNSNLSCLDRCGKCCFKKDIYCSPVELLPLALHLVKTNRAEEMLSKIEKGNLEYCALLTITDVDKFEGYCSEYKYRGIVCRTFGVSARLNKNKIEYSVCKVLKENKKEQYELLQKVDHIDQDIPLIHMSKNKLSVLSPDFMSKEYILNDSLRIMLEKVLLIKSYSYDD